MFKVVCSVCGKVRIKENSKLPDYDGLLISHAICPDCVSENYKNDLSEEIIKNIRDEEIKRNKENNEIWVEEKSKLNESEFGLGVNKK